MRGQLSMEYLMMVIGAVLIAMTVAFIIKTSMYVP
jgi:uncharacterized protein (UPF0333 family)